MRFGVAVGGALGSGEGVGVLATMLGAGDVVSAGVVAQAQSASATTNAKARYVIRRIR